MKKSASISNCLSSNSIWIALLLLLVAGCGGRSENNKGSPVEFKLGFAIGPEFASGGVIIWGEGTDKIANEKFAMTLTSDQDSRTTEIKNGEWNFYAMGWTGSSPMVGPVKCGISSKFKIESTDGSTINVPMVVNETVCSTNSLFQAFAGTAGHLSLKLINCNSVGAVVAGDTCNSAPGGAESFQVLLRDINVYSDFVEDQPLLVPPKSLISACINVTGNSVLSTPLNLPIGNGVTSFIPTIIRPYSGPNCPAGSVLPDFVFEKGLITSSTDGSYAGIVSGGEFQLFVETIGGGATPTIVGGSLAAANAYAEVHFSEPLTDSIGGPVTAADFSLTFLQGAGTATAVSISSMTDDLGNPVTASTSNFRFYLNVTGGPNGAETISIAPATGLSLFGAYGPVVNSEQWGPVNLNPLPAPSSLSYTSPVNYQISFPITANNPVVTGSVDSYSIVPALPTGLSFNTVTGVISGTPTVLSGATAYTITATNISGSTNFNLTLAVVSSAPPTDNGANPTFSATFSNSGNVTLSWTAFTDDVAVTDHKVFTFTDASCLSGMVDHGFTASAASSFGLTGLAEGTYYAKVAAYDADMNFTLSSCSASYVTIDTTAPTDNIASLQFTDNADADGSSIAVTWTAFTDSNLVNHRLYTYTNSSCSVGEVIHGLTGNTTNLNSSLITGLADGVYYGKVVAIDAAGNETVSACSSDSIIIDSSLPIDNTANLQFTAAFDSDGNDLAVSWTAFTDTNLFDHGLYTYTNSACTAGELNHGFTGATANSNSTIIDGLSDGQYWGKVTALDYAGNATQSSCSTDSIIVDSTPPTDNVADVQFTDVFDLDGTNIGLTWTAFADANLSDHRVYTYSDSSCIAGEIDHGFTGSSINNTILPTLSNGQYWAKVSAIDLAGNSTISGCSTDSIIVDNILPNIVNIASVTVDGTYGIGAAINIGITFSEIVYVTGSPQLLLETGTIDRYAIYSSGSGTPTLTFTYTVVNGDSSPDLDYANPGAFELNGGNVADMAGNVTSLSIPTPGTGGSLSANSSIIIDTTPAGPPIGFLGMNMDPTMDFVDVLFTKGVYRNGGVNPVLSSDLNLMFDQAAGSATAVSILSLEKVTGGSLTGGEKVIRVNLSWSGTPNGAEKIRIEPGCSTCLVDNTNVSIPLTDHAGWLPTGFTLTGDWGIEGINVSPSGSYVDVYFPVGVYSNVGGPVSEADFSVNINMNGGNSNVANLVGATRQDGSPLTGGETVVRLQLSLSPAPTGPEQIQIEVVDSTSVQSLWGDFILASGWSGSSEFMRLDEGYNGNVTWFNISGEMLFNNTTLDTLIAIFSEPVFADGGVNPLLLGDFYLSFSQNGGTATNANITEVKSVLGSPLKGGETMVALAVSFTGTPSGVEQLQVFPFGASSIYAPGSSTYMGASDGTLLDTIDNLLLNSGGGGSDFSNPWPVGAVMGPSYSYVDLVMGEGVYTADGIGAVLSGDFELTVQTNGGAASSVSITSITNQAGGAISPGDSIIRLHLNFTPAPTGVEDLIIRPYDSTSISDVNGNFWLYSHMIETNLGTVFNEPRLLGYSMPPSWDKITLYFSKPIYTANGSTPVLGSDFNIVFNQNGGGASAVNITTVSKAYFHGGGAATGGETAVELGLSYTGTPTGPESILIGPMTSQIANSGASLFASAGNTLGPIVLNNCCGGGGGGPPPLIVGGVMQNAGYNYIDVIASEPLFTSDGSSGVLDSDLMVNISPNGGNATGATINFIEKASGGSLTGGESVIRVHLTYTPSAPSGPEKIEIKPINGSSIKSGNGSFMDGGQTTGMVGVNSGSPDPKILYGIVPPDYNSLRVYFSKPIYHGASGGAVVPGDLQLLFTQNGGTATSAWIDTIQTVTGTSLLGGEYAIKVNILYSGTPNGNEKIELRPSCGTCLSANPGGGSLYMASTETTRQIMLSSGFSPPLPMINNQPRLIAANPKSSAPFDYVDLIFSEPVFGPDGSSMLVPTDLVVYNFAQNGGTATAAMIASVSKQDGTSLTPGVNVVRVGLSFTGTPNGAEKVEIGPATANTFKTSSNVSFQNYNTGLLQLNMGNPNITIVGGHFIDYNSIYIYFNKGVYALNGSNAVSLSAFNFTNLQANGSSVSGLSLNSALTIADTGLLGGETIVKLSINWTSGPPSGNETVEFISVAGMMADSGAVSTLPGAISTGVLTVNGNWGMGPLPEVAAGDAFTCAVNSGQVKCWGDSFFGQLGTGSSTFSLVPVAVSGLSNATRVATGGFHACAVQTDGNISCWGQGSDGQLGDSTGTLSYNPVSVSGISGLGVQIGLGNNHSCAVLNNGTVKCWGMGASGQLGDGNATNSNVPVNVLSISNAEKVEAGLSHTCVLRNDNTVSCFGGGSLGQLGNSGNSNSSSPVAVGGLSNPQDLCSGLDHSCVVQSNGEVLCWGKNTFGQLGNNSTTNSNTPVLVNSITNAIQVSCGGEFSCARLSDNSVKCWGANNMGQLGDNTVSDRLIPVLVSGLTNAAHVSAGFDHTCARKFDGTIYCWGSNMDGQLGDGSTVDSLVPILTDPL